MTQVFVEGEAKKGREGSGLEDGGRRDATKEGSGNRRFADPNSGPRVAGPDGMGANGLGQVSKREVSTPKVKRPAMLSKVASEVRPPEGAGKARQRIEKFAEPEMRNDEEGIGSYHALELGGMESDGSEDSPKLLRS